MRGPVSGKVYTFERLDALGDVAKLSPQALRRYAEYLAERAVLLDAERAHDMSYYTRVFRALIEKNCWARYRESDQRYLNRVFNRHYAYALGHYLGFTLEEMQGFISRVLPDEIFISKDAEGLAEAYGFNRGLSAAGVRSLLERYEANRGEAALDFDLIDVGGTHQLYEEASTFEGDEEAFLEWLNERRSLLEGRSRTAFAVYRNLLICAYLMLRALYDDSLANGGDRVSELWERCIDGEDMLEYYAAHSAAYRLPEYEKLDWKKAAAEFDGFSEWAPSESRERRYPRDFLTYLSIDKNGEFVTENTFSRIPLIMNSDRAVEKRDVLCLVWQIYAFAWEYVAPEDAAAQLRDFIDLATGILEQCNFTFYLPNLLEYSICRSLIVGGDMEDSYRSVIAQGANSPLCEDICIRDTSGALYGARFYACEEYTFDEIAETLYAVSRGERINVYNDVWKNIELWLTKADQQLQCGWDRIEDPRAIEQIAALERVIELPQP